MHENFHALLCGSDVKELVNFHVLSIRHISEVLENFRKLLCRKAEKDTTRKCIVMQNES